MNEKWKTSIFEMELQADNQYNIAPKRTIFKRTHPMPALLNNLLISTEWQCQNALFKLKTDGQYF